MRAMVLPRFGGSNLFEMHELERPEPGCGEVLVRVVASAVNPVDAKLRVDGGWAKLDPPVILGYDVAGIVEEVGPGISDFKIGTRSTKLRKSLATHMGVTPITMSQPLRLSRINRPVCHLSKPVRFRLPGARLGRR